MKTINKCLLTALSACVWCANATAQQDTAQIRRDVDVVNAYQPTLHRARKLNIAPVMDDTMSYKPNFNYVTLNRIASVMTAPDSLTAADMRFPSYESPYRAMVQGGVGSAPTLFGQIVYNIGNSSKYHLALRAGHLAMLGKVKMEDDSKAKAPQNDTWASANFYRFFDEVRLGADFKFKNSVYNYYGLNSIADTVLYHTEEGTPVNGGDLADAGKQRNTTVDVDFNLANKMVNAREEFTYEAHAGFGIFGNKTGVRQTDLRFAGALRFPVVGAGSIYADVAVNHYKVHAADSISPLYAFTERHSTDINAFPQFLLEYDFMKLQFGLRVIAIVGDEHTKDDLLVQPDINANFFIGDGSVRFYAGITGDYAPNSYRSLVERNRYVSADMRKYLWVKSSEEFVLRDEIRPSQSPIVFKVGLRANFSKMAQLHLGFDYRSLGDEVFFVNRSYITADSTAHAHGSTFALLQDDGKLMRVHGELNVNPTAKSNVNIGATYYSYKMDYVEEAWNRPTYRFDIKGSFMPLDRLKVMAQLGVNGQRYAFNPTLREKEKLPLYVDLNIAGHYYISNRWTAFLSLNNLTASDERMWLGYSSYRVNVMGGITYKF